MVSWRRSFRRIFGIDLSQKAADDLVVSCDIGAPFLFPILHLAFSALENQGQDIFLLTRERDHCAWKFYRHRVSSSPRGVQPQDSPLPAVFNARCADQVILARVQ